LNVNLPVAQALVERRRQQLLQARRLVKRHRLHRLVGEEEGGEASEAPADDRHAHHGARVERDAQPVGEALLGGAGGAQVGAHRNLHAEPAGQSAQRGTDNEAQRRLPPELVVDGGQHTGAKRNEAGQRNVLLFQKCSSTSLNSRCNLLHFSYMSKRC
jgi:hypothetical protein